MEHFKGMDNILKIDYKENQLHLDEKIINIKEVTAEVLPADDMFYGCLSIKTSEEILRFRFDSSLNKNMYELMNYIIKTK